VSQSGYIELKSNNDLIIINNEKYISAAHLNENISRKKIISMSTIDDGKGTAVIFTRK